ncbi:hypothetical protein [uncultured Shewanella sp.]|uniref:hypothetical protein n=1 Tax=Shewanella atlantica TaxID=271099 RepID=UPI00261B1DFC|nr:hypothetical protein [uncultured Shewanella sp.]
MTNFYDNNPRLRESDEEEQGRLRDKRNKHRRRQNSAHKRQYLEALSGEYREHKWQ